MIWAKEGEKRIKATSHAKAKCPICEEEVIAKCGNIMIHHWAHKSKQECDTWAGETEWHLNWKNHFPEETQEVVLTLGSLKHRADVYLRNQGTIEFQSSPLSELDIHNREVFYDNLTWVLNGQTIGKGICLRKNEGNYVTFRWKHPPKSWWKSRATIYVDLGNNKMLEIRKLYDNIPCGGWGYLIEKKDFLERYGGTENVKQ